MYRIIIVDDEEAERNLIGIVIKKMVAEVEVVSFSNGFDVIDYLKDNDADLLLTDIKMPKMSGIELIEKVCALDGDIRIVILSGFAEFEYAKKAMKYGVKDYLVKPVDIKELEKILLEIKQEILEESYREIQNDNTDEIEEFFEDLCIGAFQNEEEIKQRFNKLNLPYGFDETNGYVLRVIYNSGKDEKNSDGEKIENGLKNMLTGFLNCEIYGFYSKNNIFLYFVFTNKQIDENMINTQIEGIFGEKVELSIVTHFNNIAQIKGEIFDIKDKIELYISRIISNDTEFCKNIANNIINNYEMNPIVTKGSHEMDVIYKLFKEKNIISIRDFVKRIYSVDNDEDSIIRKTEGYIRENYQRDINRAEVAEYVHMNPSYFSRYFKKKKGVNFYDYLTDFRIEKAKTLLKKGMSVEEVTWQTGFSSSKTFRRNFMMKVNMSPREYRNSILK